MLSRFLAILLFVLLTVLPVVGGAIAFPSSEHCSPATHSMTMEHSGHSAAAETDCHHGGPHPQLPCAMTGMCPMTGCMALVDIMNPGGVVSSLPVSFRNLDALRLDGLAPAPLLEPPRA